MEKENKEKINKEKITKEKINKEKKEKINKEKINKEKKEKKNKQKKVKKKDENIIRIVSNTILNLIKRVGLTNALLGMVYTYAHYILIFLVAFVFSFNSNITHLCILLIIITLDAFSIVVFHGCPLTHLEQKYLHENSCEMRSNVFKNAKIVYKCDHEYEKQIELLINVWMLIATKCLLLICFNTINCKLNNYNNTYA